jgi:Arc/MetJ-type ribon-helix-helix transcriptional regulator
MIDTEKVTINMSVVDLGQIDLLVGEGFYSSRTDFIRTAIRNLLATHAQQVKEVVTRKSSVVGAIIYDQKDFKKLRDAGQQLELHVVGLLMLDDDIPSELARDVIKSLTVRGVFKASEKIKDALKDRMT